MLRRLTEKISDARRPYPNKHLDEVRPGNAEKRYPRFASHSASQQLLTRARRPDQQPPLRNSTAESLIFCGFLRNSTTSTNSSSASSMPSTSAKVTPVFFSI